VESTKFKYSAERKREREERKRERERREKESGRAEDRGKEKESFIPRFPDESASSI
jgi:hypothetical protein